MYPHLAHFQTYCTQLIIRDRVDQKNRYIIRVKTAGNDHGDDEATGGDLDDGCEAWTSYHGDSMCREPVDIKLIVPAP